MNKTVQEAYNNKLKNKLFGLLCERKKKCKALFRQLRRVYAPVANEFIVYDAEDGLCGTIDMLAYNMKKGTYAIFDWKTSKEFKKDDPFSSQRRIFSTASQRR